MMMIPIIIVMVLLSTYVIVADYYYKLIDQSYERKLTDKEWNTFNQLDKCKKILSIYYPIYNRKYKRNLKNKYDEFKKTAFEDRDNDWLAREIAAEKALERKMDASEMLRLDHIRNHNREDERTDRL